jgi:putative nucleotidyltransferase with HDIG domain
MKIDLDRAKKVFAEYVSNYDNRDNMILTKIEHTYRVMEVSIKIAEGLNLSEEDVSLAGLIGLLHDIGRFEQIRIAHTYSDLKSGIDHASFGVKILFDENKILDFLPETRMFDQIIKIAVGQHNKFTIEEGLNERENLHAKIIRDADKIDILKIYTMPEEDTVVVAKSSGYEINNKISAELVEALFENKQVYRTHIRYFLDWYINSITFLFDINYSESFKIIRDNNYIDKIIKEGIRVVPEQEELFIKIKNHMNNYMIQKIKN